MYRDRPQYSYRRDADVTPFDDDGPRTVMDAECALCARGARWIARNDRAGKFRIIPAQSPLGQALLRHYDLDPDDPASWLYLVDGHAYCSLDAIIRTGARLGGVWRLLGVLRILPRTVQNWLYARIARNRYRLFGRADMCALPDAELQRRLLR